MCEHQGFAGLDIEGLLDVAEAALRRIGTLPLGGAVDDVALTRMVQRLTAVERIAAGQRASAIRELDQRHAAKGQAAGSTADLLARTLRLSPGEARREAELAEGLAALPDTQKALADGRIGVSQAHVAVKKANEVASRDDAEGLLSKIDQTAASAGQVMDRNRLARQIDGELAKSNMDVLADRERTAFQRRSLSWTVRDGMHVLHAELDPVGGSTVRAMLDRLSTKTDERDTRSFPQRQTDALVHMATLAKANEGKPQTTLQSARILLVTLRCAGLRRNRPSALQGTRPRLGLGHPEFAFGRPRRRARRTRTHQPRSRRGQTRQACVVGAGPRVLAIRQRTLRTGAGRTGIRACGLGRSRGPAARDDTSHGWRCHTHIHQSNPGRHRALPRRPTPAP